MAELIIIGAGSQAKAIISAARQAGMTVRAIYDDDCARCGQTVLGVPITGPLTQAVGALVPAVMCIDDAQQRKAIAEQLDISWGTVIHPNAFLHPSATVGPGTVILEGVVIQPSVTIGKHVLVAANATVAHDCVVENFAHIGPGVDLAGAVRIGEGAIISVGAVVIPNMRVGAWTTVGPRAAVICDLPDHIHAAGLPAKPVDEDGSHQWANDSEP
ncbi:MAG TPA: NeuD/PglB/VioB family sugar acetyltransferase [Pirellulales bacterium]|jgi:sugar O-acyltransferase (sialic acid O-acetyltransferase NeuD family)